MKRSILGILVVVFLLTSVHHSPGQSFDILKKIPHEIPGLDVIRKSEPAITTCYADAVYGVPFLDDFNPDEFRSLDSLDRTPEGYYKITPGRYIFDVQSFCLKAATYEPRDGGKGDGYLYAPTKGPRARIVTNIIRRSFDHPEISQQDIQTLLWAIISYTKLSDMSDESQRTADELLTPSEMYEINNGALGLIPENLLDKATDKLPSEVGRMLRAEAQLRNLLTKGQTTYEELERVAVLRGTPPQVEEEGVPDGRWSLRPEGFFIRYFPSDYTRTRVDIYVPEIFQIELDELGRITLIADEDGNRIETTYDHSVRPIVVDDEHSLQGFAFGSIRFEYHSGSGDQKQAQVEWKKLGWTLVGIPAQGELIEGTFPGRFSGVKERYDWAKVHKSELVELDRQFKPQGDLDVIMNLGHYSVALKAVLDSQEAGDPGWAVEHLNIVKKAWQFAVWLREMYTDADEESGYEYFGNDAIPRPATRRQRLAMRLFVEKMNWHKLPGFRYLHDQFQWEWEHRHSLDKYRPAREILKPMLIAGTVWLPPHDPMRTRMPTQRFVP